MGFRYTSVACWLVARSIPYFLMLATIHLHLRGVFETLTDLVGLTYHEVEMNLLISGNGYLGVDRASCGLLRGHSRKVICAFVSLAGLCFPNGASSLQLVPYVSMLRSGYPPPCVSCLAIDPMIISH